MLQYLHISPDQPLPKLSGVRFRTLIISELAVSQEWRTRVAEWLIQSGCLYVSAWGVDCEEWHDTVDQVNLEDFNFGDIPDDRFVMTTWHNGEQLSEAMWFAGQCANHPDVELKQTVILHVADQAKPEAMLEAFSVSQMLPDGE